MASKVTFHMNGKAYEVSADPQTFTAAELNAVERYAGMTVGEWGMKLQNDTFSNLAWSALAWIALRRGGVFMRWDEFEAGITSYDLVRSFERVEGDDDSGAADQAAPQVVTPAPNRAARRAKGAASA